MPWCSGERTWVCAPNIEDAPLEHARLRFSFAFLRRAEARIELFLEAERGQLPLWFVAAFASGIAAWLWLPGPAQWGAFIVLALAIALCLRLSALGFVRRARCVGEPA